MSALKLALVCITVAAIALSAYYFYPETTIENGVVIDSIAVLKAKHQMRVYSKNELVKTYTIAIGLNPIGKKEYEGDKKTPEGHYTIYDKNPNSKYHKNLGISYPNATDKANAESLGKPPGGDVKIHGCNNKQSFLGKFQRWTDWTFGCVAVTNEEIDELYKHVAVGTPVSIVP